MPTTIGEKEYYSVDEAAKYLGVCTRTIHRRIKKAKIRAVQLGENTSPYWISKVELDRYIREKGGNGH